MGRRLQRLVHVDTFAGVCLRDVRGHAHRNVRRRVCRYAVQACVCRDGFKDACKDVCAGTCANLFANKGVGMCEHVPCNRVHTCVQACV